MFVGAGGRATYRALSSAADRLGVLACFTGNQPRLTFFVVGPMVDIKLISLQSGTFGPQFARRFAPLTLLVAILTSSVIGAVLL